MPTFNCSRLKSARLLAGLSLRQVEEALSSKVTHNSINKYEKGIMQPEPGTVIRLAEVLKVSPSFFFESNTIDLGEISFRKKSSLTKTEIEQIKERTKDKVTRHLEAERLLNISSVFLNPIVNKEINDPEEAEELAEIVRNEWRLGSNPLSNVIEMLEENYVKVIEIDAPEKFDGMSTYVDDGIPVTVVNESFPVERKRFTALHELGHLMMNLSMDNDREKESACHRFAGAMLFPASEVKKTFGERRRNIALGELVAVKEEYGISVQAAIRRLYDLEVISSSSYLDFCRRTSKNKKENGMGAFRGEEKSYRLMSLIFRLTSEGIIDVDKAADLAGMRNSDYISIYNNSPKDDETYMYAIGDSAFANAWGNSEPEYSIDDVKIVNSDYEGR